MDIKGRYTRDYRVGIEELGYSDRASMKALLVFMEDCACWHSAGAGYGVREVDTIHRAWVVLDWKIKITRYPVYDEKLSVSTWSRKMDGIRAYRDFEVKDADGAVIAIGTSKWILTDTERRRPVRLTDDIVAAYETDGTYVVMGDEIEDIMPGDDELAGASEAVYNVRRSDIDCNGHVHNINYLDIASEAMPEDVYMKLIRGEYTNLHILYKKEIMYGDEIVCRYACVDGVSTVTMCVESKVHAVVKLE